MSSAFEKLLAKKKAKGEMLPEQEQSARGSVLEDLIGNMGERQAKKLDGLKKVSVMADSEEGLKAGLDKAKDVVGKMPEAMDGDEESPEEEASESPDEEHEEELSKEELQAQIDELKAKLAHLGV
jgi:hypothetical protein